MTNELQDTLNQALQDKTTNLLPENLKAGVTCLGVEGRMQSGVDGSIEDKFITLPARSIVNGKISVNPDMFVTIRYNNSSGELDALGFKRFCFIKTSSIELPLYVDSSNENIDYVSLWIHSDGTVEPYSSSPTSGSTDNSAVFKKFNAMPDVANTLEEKTNLQTITSLTDEVFNVTTLNLANENGWICSGVKLIEDYNPDATERLYTSPDSTPSQATNEVAVRNIFGKEQRGEISDYGDGGNFALNNAGDIGEVTYTYKPFNYDVLGFKYKFRKGAGVIRPGLRLDLYTNFSTIVEAGGITADKIRKSETIYGITGTANFDLDGVVSYQDEVSLLADTTQKVNTIGLVQTYVPGDWTFNKDMGLNTFLIPNEFDLPAIPTENKSYSLYYTNGMGPMTSIGVSLPSEWESKYTVTEGDSMNGTIKTWYSEDGLHFTGSEDIVKTDNEYNWKLADHLEPTEEDIAILQAIVHTLEFGTPAVYKWNGSEWQQYTI